MPDLREEMIRHLEKQGAHVRKTKKGLYIQTPKGTATTHLTYGDYRSVDNDIANFRRIGLVHPEDKRMRQPAKRKKRPRTEDGYPDFVRGSMRKETLDRLRQYLHDAGWPVEITAKDLEPFARNYTAIRALYHTGYRYHPDGKHVNHSQVWVAPDDIQELHLELVTRPDPKPENKPSIFLGERSACGHESWELFDGGARKCTDCREELPPLEGAWEAYGVKKVEPAKKPKEEVMAQVPNNHAPVTSWTVDPKELFGSTTYQMMEEKLATLRAVGIEIEIRAWRKEQ